MREYDTFQRIPTPNAVILRKAQVGMTSWHSLDETIISLHFKYLKMGVDRSHSL
jgi:hypothetical protein